MPKASTVKVKDRDKGLIQINNVRLGMRCLWEENVYKGKPTGRQIARFIFSKEEQPQLREIFSAALEIYKKRFSNATAKSEEVVTRFKKSEHNPGDIIFCTSNAENYPAKFYNNQGALVHDPKGAKVEHSILYAGCRVNALVQINTSQGSDKLWVNLVGIQFAEHDAPIGGLSEGEIGESFGEVDNDFGMPEAPTDAGKKAGSTADSLDDFLGGAGGDTGNDLDNLFGSGDDVPF